MQAKRIYLKNSSVGKENIFLDVVVVPTHKVSNNNNNGGHGNTGVWQRLSNKIKALELNVSITGRYLEELSVQYKKQIEDLTLAVGQSKDALLTGKYLKKNFFDGKWIIFREGNTNFSVKAFFKALFEYCHELFLGFFFLSFFSY